MTDLNTKNIIDALELANHPNYSFTLTKKDTTKFANETHYNFSGKSADLTEPTEGDRQNLSTTNYTVIINEKSGGVFLKQSSTDVDGKPIKGSTDQLVGAWSSVDEFNKALKKATSEELSPGTALESMHNVEFAKTASHGMPTGKGVSPEIEAGAAR